MRRPSRPCSGRGALGVGRVPLRAADGGEQDGVGALAGGERLVGQRRAVGVDRGAAERVLLEGEVVGDGGEHLERRGEHLGADPVAGEGDDRGHGPGSVMEYGAPGGVSPTMTLPTVTEISAVPRPPTRDTFVADLSAAARAPAHAVTGPGPRRRLGPRASCRGRRRAANVAGMLRTRLSSTAGQVAAEYLGGLLLVAVVIGALIGAQVHTLIAVEVERAICKITGVDRVRRAGRAGGRGLRRQRARRPRPRGPRRGVRQRPPRRPGPRRGRRPLRRRRGQRRSTTTSARSSTTTPTRSAATPTTTPAPT